MTSTHNRPIVAHSMSMAEEVSGFQTYIVSGSPDLSHCDALTDGFRNHQATTSTRRLQTTAMQRSERRRTQPRSTSPMSTTSPLTIVSSQLADVTTNTVLDVKTGSEGDDKTWTDRDGPSNTRTDGEETSTVKDVPFSSTVHAAQSVVVATAAAALAATTTNMSRYLEPHTSRSSLVVHDPARRCPTASTTTAKNGSFVDPAASSGYESVVTETDVTSPRSALNRESDGNTSADDVERKRTSSTSCGPVKTLNALEICDYTFEDIQRLRVRRGHGSSCRVRLQIC